jgi:aquaporin Z
VNPAVTLGAYISRRITLIEAAGYWVAQLAGGIVGALLLYWMMRTSPFYSKSKIGLGANGYGPASSILHVNAGGAFLVEVILTTFFVLVVLSLTRSEASIAVSGMGIGIALALVNLIGIPFDGASVNPARSLGPAVVVGGAALSQVWVFLLAPLVGALLAAGLNFLVHPTNEGLIFTRQPAREASAGQAGAGQAEQQPGGARATTGSADAPDSPSGEHPGT